MKQPANKALGRLLPIALSHGFAVFCGLAGVKLVSRFVPPEKLGIYGVFVTFTTLGMWIFHSGLVKYVGRHWAAEADKAPFLRRVLRSWLRRLPWLCGASLLGALFLSRLSGVPFPTLGLALFASASLLSLATVFQTALQAGQEHWRDLGVVTLSSSSRSFVPPLLFAGIGAASGLYLGFALHACVAAVASCAFCLRKKDRSSGPVTDASIPEVYEGPLFLSLAAASWALSGVNRWLAVLSLSDAEAGYFTLASNIALVVPAVIGGMVQQFAQPVLFRQGDARASEREIARHADRLALVYFLVAATALACLRLCAPWLVGPLIDEKYRAALPWLLPAGAFGIATGLTGFYSMALLAVRREKACGPVELGAAALLLFGGVGFAFSGSEIFGVWLLCSPLVALLWTRPLARRYLLRGS